MILNKIQKGDQIKLCQSGITWTVWHKTNGKNLYPVIQVKSENGSFRTYNPESKRWDSQVWYA